MKLWQVWYQSGDKIKSVIIKAKTSKSAVHRSKVGAVDCWEVRQELNVRRSNG